MRFFLSFIVSILFLLLGNAVNAELSPIKEDELQDIQTIQTVEIVKNEQQSENKSVKNEEDDSFSTVFENDEKRENKIPTKTDQQNQTTKPSIPENKPKIKSDNTNKLLAKNKAIEKEKQLIIKAQNITIEGLDNNKEDSTNVVTIKEQEGDIYINIEPQVSVSCGGQNCNKNCKQKKPITKKTVKKKTKKNVPIVKKKVKKYEPVIKSKIPEPLEVYGDITEDDWISQTKPRDFLYEIECLNKCKTKLDYNISDQDIANLPLQDERHVVVSPLLPKNDVVKIMQRPTQRIEDPVLFKEPESKTKSDINMTQQMKETKIIYKEQPENLNVITEIIIDNERMSLIDNSINSAPTKTKSTSAQNYNYSTSNKAFAFVDNLD